ncbi:MAG: hypothetical protein KF729_05215 [Sandaracinaceae bacterium]|nr:hypothetical protein [Sandaracinaceae bacterium]
MRVRRATLVRARIAFALGALWAAPAAAQPRPGGAGAAPAVEEHAHEGAHDDEAASEPPPRLEVLPGQYPEATGQFYGGQGLWAGTPDRAFTLRASGFSHVDTRIASTGGPDLDEANFYLRRIRFAVDGRFLGNFEYRVMWDILVDPALPYDFHLDWRAMPELNVRVGGFKSPFGFERRARAYALWFIDRALPTSLAPNRELGVFVYGQTRDGFFSYDVALVGGAEDLGVLYDFRSGTPELAGRLYFQPFRLFDAPDALRHLGVGVSFTLGEELGAPQDPRLGSVRAMPRRSALGGRLLYAYRSDETGTVIAHGRRDRQSVHAHWHHGPINTLFEYVRSAQEVRLVPPPGGVPRDVAIAHHAWQLVLSLTLTEGDENTFFGVTPTRPFDPRLDQWGAATVSVRYQEIYFDRAVFPALADPSVSARAARAAAVSLQWHINLLLEVQTDVEVMVLEGGAPGGADAPAEISWMTRIEGRY